MVNIISKWYEMIFLGNKLSPNYIIEMIMIMTWTTLKTRTLTFERVDFAAVRLVSDDDIYTACRVLYSLFLVMWRLEHTRSAVNVHLKLCQHCWQLTLKQH